MLACDPSLLPGVPIKRSFRALWESARLFAGQNGRMRQRNPMPRAERDCGSIHAQRELADIKGAWALVYHTNINLRFR